MKTVVLLAVCGVLMGADGGPLDWLAPFAYAASSYLGSRGGVRKELAAIRKELEALAGRVRHLETKTP